MNEGLLSKMNELPNLNYILNITDASDDSVQS